MHVLVTGGCGYVGNVLVPKLLALGHRVTVVDLLWFGNQLKPHANLELVQQDVRNADRIPMEGVNTVIHLANVANDPCGDLDPKLSWEVNVLASKLLIERAIQSKVSQFIFSSSGSVYGVKDEDEVTEELSLVPISDYNKTKMISERVLLSYASDILVHCIRPATVCGLSARTRLDVSVNMITMQALSRGKITVFGGDQTRPNIHVADLVGVFLHMMDLRERATGIFNAGFENLSIMEIAQKVSKLVPSEIVVSPSNDPRSYRLSSKKLLATGFKPQFGVDVAIRELIDAFRAGELQEMDSLFNIKVMKKLNFAEMSHVGSGSS